MWRQRASQGDLFHGLKCQRHHASEGAKSSALLLPPFLLRVAPAFPRHVSLGKGFSSRCVPCFVAAGGLTRSGPSMHSAHAQVPGTAPWTGHLCQPPWATPLVRGERGPSPGPWGSAVLREARTRQQAKRGLRGAAWQGGPHLGPHPHLLGIGHWQWEPRRVLSLGFPTCKDLYPVTLMQEPLAGSRSVVSTLLRTQYVTDWARCILLNLSTALSPQAAASRGSLLRPQDAALPSSRAPAELSPGSCPGPAGGFPIP